MEETELYKSSKRKNMTTILDSKKNLNLILMNLSEQDFTRTVSCETRFYENAAYALCAIKCWCLSIAIILFGKCSNLALVLRKTVMKTTLLRCFLINSLCFRWSRLPLKTRKIWQFKTQLQQWDVIWICDSISSAISQIQLWNSLRGTIFNLGSKIGKHNFKPKVGLMVMMAARIELVTMTHLQ